MARKRMLDPRFFTDQKVMELPFEGRLLFAGIWCFANDQGIHINNAKVLKAEIFPGDEITIEEILDLRDRLLDLGMIEEDITRKLFRVINWELYQSISHPQPSKYEFVPFIFPTDSENTHGMTTEQGRNNNGTFLPSIVEPSVVKTKIEEPLVRKTKKSPKPVKYVDKVNNYFDSINKDKEYMELLKESFPNVDLDQELRGARAWLLSNTDKAKSKFKAFVTRWMNKAMERGSYNNKSNIVIDTSSEIRARKEKNDREKYVEEASKDAASEEEYKNILKDTVESLRAHKKERLKNVTNTEN